MDPSGEIASLMSKPKPKPKGAPTGNTRLGAYFLVLGTVGVSVLVLTFSSMQFLETAFGIDSKAVSTVQLRFHEMKESVLGGGGGNTNTDIDIDIDDTDDIWWTDNTVPDRNDEDLPTERTGGDSNNDDTETQTTKKPKREKREKKDKKETKNEETVAERKSENANKENKDKKETKNDETVETKSENANKENKDKKETKNDNAAETKSENANKENKDEKETKNEETTVETKSENSNKENKDKKETKNDNAAETKSENANKEMKNEKKTKNENVAETKSENANQENKDKKETKNDETVETKSENPNKEDEEKPDSGKSSNSWSSSMLDSVLKSRQTMVDKLRKDYGDQYFESIFLRSGDFKDKPTPEKLKMEYLILRPLSPEDVNHSNHWDEDSDKMKEYRHKTDLKYFHSISNLRRKMMIKILAAQQDSSANTNKYIWVTGGHSAAAGHGNLFRETYTKVMEATSSKVFETAGLELEARNYAMGATSSAAEMSMCFREIYGENIDIFSWDFGMLESSPKLAGRLIHYATRGFQSSSSNSVVPAFVALQEINQYRKDAMLELNEAYRGDGDDSVENNGLALFLRDDEVWKAVREAIPESAGISGDEINQIPEFLRNLKCDGRFEKGEPFCAEQKYSDEICPNRMSQVSWHPGWKVHALMGNAMALFLAEMLVGAVRQIDDTMHNSDDHPSPEKLLSELWNEENAHRDRMLQAQPSQLPKSFDKIYWYNNTSDNYADFPEDGSGQFQDKWKHFDRDALFRGPSICHTARVPSQTRFLGHMSNQPEMTGTQAAFQQETYFTGIEDKEYNAQSYDDPSTPHAIQLVWVMHQERQEGCGDVLAKPDYHDFFMTKEDEGWTVLHFPNEAEQDAYDYHKHKDQYKGILIMVPRFCGFGNCEKGFLGNTDYNDGKWTMKVNGKLVTALTMIGHDAILLEHKDGILFEPNDRGNYRMEFKVKEPESFIKISAFVLY